MMRRAPLVLLLAISCGSTLQEKAACLGIGLPEYELPDFGQPATADGGASTDSRAGDAAAAPPTGGRLVDNAADCAELERLLGNFQGGDECGCRVSAVEPCAAQIRWFGSEADCKAERDAYGYRPLEDACVNSAAYSNWIRIDVADARCTASYTGKPTVSASAVAFYCPTGGTCSRHAGLVACPVGANRTTWATSFRDERACACNCAAQCHGAATLYADGMCSDAGFASEAGCNSYASVRAARYAATLPTTSASPFVTGSLHIDWVTICCR